MKHYCPICWRPDTKEPVPCPDCDGDGFEKPLDFDGCHDTCPACNGYGEQEGEFQCKECHEPFDNFIPENKLDKSDRDEIELQERNATRDPMVAVDEYSRIMLKINRRHHVINNAAIAAIAAIAILVGLVIALVAYVKWGI